MFEGFFQLKRHNPENDESVSLAARAQTHR
jgi:hypothetical protein